MQLRRYRSATGVSFVLNGVTQAILAGGLSDNSFDVTGFNGNATLTGSGGNAEARRVEVALK